MYYYALFAFLFGMAVSAGIAYNLYKLNEQNLIEDHKSKMESNFKEGFDKGWNAADEDPIIELKHYSRVSERMDSFIK